MRNRSYWNDPREDPRWNFSK